MRPARTALLLVACLGVLPFMSGCFWDMTTSASVEVPVADRTDIQGRFDGLRDAGLRVSIPESFTVASLHSPGVRGEMPRTGTRVPVDAVVTLRLGQAPLGSPAVCQPAPTWTVEDLRGLSLAEAIERVPRCFFWEARDLPPLQASEAPGLFDAYRVVGQQPAPGTRLQPGIMKPGVLETGYRPTPVIFEAEVADAG